MKSTKKNLLVAGFLSVVICIVFLIGIVWTKSSPHPKQEHTSTAGFQYSLPKAIPTAWFTGS